MTTSTTSTNLAFLIDQGKELPKLLIEATNTRLNPGVDNNIQDKVKTIVTNVLNIKNATQKAFFPQESIEKLMKKIELTLKEFIKYDPEHKSGYEDLIEKVAEFQYKKKGSNLTQFFSAAINRLDEPIIDQSAIKELNPEDYQRLCYFLLFPVEVGIKKREILHCWIGMGWTGVPAGERLLAKFVEMGLIQRPLVKRKLINVYKMPANVHSYLSNRQTTPLDLKQIDGSWSILCKQVQPSESNVKSYLRRLTTMRPSSKIIQHKNPNLNVIKEDPDDTGSKETIIKPVIKEDHEELHENDHHNPHKDDSEALLNVYQTTLNVERFKTMSKMSKLKVLHLGSWQQDSKRYIVVEDTDAFKYLKKLSSVRFLSLEGVSGMVKLPRYIYELESLQVLDLRGCYNLELIQPEIKSGIKSGIKAGIVKTGIKALTNLTHLDLSGCYLLDHVPLGITFLSALKVLKGFIINDDHLSEEGEHVSSSPCQFKELSKLKHLEKLTILTRRTNFPTRDDFETFLKLDELSCLRITWVGHSTMESHPTHDRGKVTSTFPATLRKLELQAAPDHTASRVLELMSKDTGNCGLEKLYIKGGGLRELKNYFPQPTVVRLRYLPELHIDWEDFTKLFPNLDRLEVLGCPNFILCPCDENGVWENSPTF